MQCIESPECHAERTRSIRFSPGLQQADSSPAAQNDLEATFANVTQPPGEEDTDGGDYSKLAASPSRSLRVSNVCRDEDRFFVRRDWNGNRFNLKLNSSESETPEE